MAEDLDVGSTPPEESGNRVFLIGTIILGSVFLLALVAIVVLFLLTRGGGQAQPAVDLTATFNFQLGVTQTAALKSTQQKAASQTAAITVTSTATRTATRTATLTSSPVVFSTLALTDTPTQPPAGTTAPAVTTAPTTKPGADTATATKAASPAKTAAPTATALPATGFGDQAGLPGLLAMAGLFLLIIILARQLRTGIVRR